MLFLFGCLAAAIIFGGIMLCKVIDAIRKADQNKVSEDKIIAVVCFGGLMISWFAFFMDLANRMGY